MKKINVNCPVGKTGYGITSLNILKNLYSKEIEVSLFPIGQNMELNSDGEKQIINNMIKNSESFDHLFPCLKIWHQFDLASRIGSGKYFSFPFFEIDKLKPKEVVHLNSCDGIFSASAWGKDILQQNGVKKPIHICPLGVDMSIFNVPNRIKINEGNYVFFHIGKWEHRKSQDFLIQAFNNAFDEDDDVELRLLPHNPFLNDKELEYWANILNSSKLRNKIKVFDRLPTQYHLAEFIFRGDCAVFLSRAEGWNNEITECMAMNKPVIATDYSAHTEYCDNQNSFLVKIDTTEPANDGKWFHGEGNWAKLSSNQMDQTVEHMRYVYNNDIRSNPNGIETAKKYSWNQTAQTIINTIFTGSHNANTIKKAKRR